MSSNSKVVWSDGLFVKPHHFQQNTRWTESLVQKVTKAIQPNCFGLLHYKVNEEMLAQGKVSLVSASGIMPDGTPFDLPTDDEPPAALEIDEGFTANELVYLCIPYSIDGGVEVEAHQSSQSEVASRFVRSDVALRDNTVQAGELAQVPVQRAKPLLMLGSKDLSAFARIVIGRIIEKRNDGAIVWDNDFLPTMLSISSSASLIRFLATLADGVDNRAEAIAARIGKPDQNGVAEVSDFLLLQALNRISPRLRHFVRLPVMHPEETFQFLISIVGELSTFLRTERTVPDLPIYDHANPQNCWVDVMTILRGLFAASMQANAVRIDHAVKRHGYVLAPVPERQILSSEEYEFVLAIKANVPQDRLHRDFVAQCKVSSIQKIRDLVQKQLPGIPLKLMPVAPRQLPYHAGYSYFALDRTTEAWRFMDNTEGFAFHIAGEFPDLQIQFWAYKG